jgi:hypothetical protein
VDKRLEAFDGIEISYPVPLPAARTTAKANLAQRFYRSISP